MSDAQFTLNPGFFKPGQKITFIMDNELKTEVISEVNYTGPIPELRKKLGRWESLWRRLTPRKWRGSIPIIRQAQSASVSVKTIPVWMYESQRLVDKLANTEATDERT